MGRPLLSTLITPAATAVAPAVRIAEPDENKNLSPTYGHWSYVNAFDPDSDEFFEGEDVVYEAFLSPEQIEERERERETENETMQENDVRADPDTPTAVRVPVSSQTSVRGRFMTLRAVLAAEGAAPAPGEDERPELISPTADDSSSSGSDTTNSGRASPADTGELLDSSRSRVRRDSMVFPWHPADLEDELAETSMARAITRPSSATRSLPTTPTHSVARRPWWEAIPPLGSPPTDSSAPVDIPTPASPMPHPAQAVASSPYHPMSPPGSVTPRFLTWGSNGSRPRAIDMSPSPTPAGPFGSARSAASRSRMSLSHISSPALRVQL